MQYSELNKYNAKLNLPNLQCAYEKDSIWKLQVTGFPTSEKKSN